MTITNNILHEMYKICDLTDYFWGIQMHSVLYNQKIDVFTIIPIYSAFVKEMKEQNKKKSSENGSFLKYI